MGQLVRVRVPAPDDVIRDYGAGALIDLERSTTEAGAYASVTTKLVVTETYSYEINDPAGTTSSWYRSRFRNAAGTVFSEYGRPWSYSAPRAYASLDDLMMTMSQTLDDTRLLANAEQRLEDAAIALDREIGYTALRSTGTFILHGTKGSVLHVHRGIISLSSVEIRLETGGAWIALQAQDTGWYLEGRLNDPNPVVDVYYHLRLITLATYPDFVPIPNSVRLVGTLGGNADARRAANVAWARQAIALDPSNPGGLLVGPDDLGNASNPDRWPRAVFDLVQAERRRFLACSM